MKEEEYVRFDVLSVATMKSTVFWDVIASRHIPEDINLQDCSFVYIYILYF
jgi:hypothetical protein